MTAALDKELFFSMRKILTGFTANPHYRKTPWSHSATLLSGPVLEILKDSGKGVLSISQGTYGLWQDPKNTV